MKDRKKHQINFTTTTDNKFVRASHIMLIVFGIFLLREEGERGTILVSLLNRVSRAVLQFGNTVEPAKS